MSKLNIAAFHTDTRALGPGVRSVVWFQGCPFRCQGCFSTDWIPDIPNLLVEAGALAHELVSSTCEGVTISGGEPFHQSHGLLELIEHIKRIEPNYSIILYTGFTKAQLERSHHAGIHAKIIALADVLIDGLYHEKSNDNAGLRGSTNQVVHDLSGRYADYNFHTGQRRQEYVIKESTVQIVGLPDIIGGGFVRDQLVELIR